MALNSTEGLADKGVCEKAAGYNIGVCIRETNIQNLYMCIVDVGAKWVTEMAVPRAQP